MATIFTQYIVGISFSANEDLYHVKHLLPPKVYPGSKSASRYISEGTDYLVGGTHQKSRERSFSVFPVPCGGKTALLVIFYRCFFMIRACSRGYS